MYCNTVTPTFAIALSRSLSLLSFTFSSFLPLSLSHPLFAPASWSHREFEFPGGRASLKPQSPHSQSEYKCISIPPPTFTSSIWSLLFPPPPPTQPSPTPKTFNHLMNVREPGLRPALRVNPNVNLCVLEPSAAGRHNARREVAPGGGPWLHAIRLSRKFPQIRFTPTTHTHSHPSLYLDGTGGFIKLT